MTTFLLSLSAMILLAGAVNSMNITQCGTEAKECQGKAEDAEQFFDCIEEEGDLDTCAKEHVEALKDFVHCGYVFHYCDKAAHLTQDQEEKSDDVDENECGAKARTCLSEDEDVESFFKCLEKSIRNQKGCIGQHKEGYKQFIQCGIDFWYCNKAAAIVAADE